MGTFYCSSVTSLKALSYTSMSVSLVGSFLISPALYSTFVRIPFSSASNNNSSIVILYTRYDLYLSIPTVFIKNLGKFFGKIFRYIGGVFLSW